MSKNIIKLSGLFCFIFIGLLFLFFQFDVSAAPNPTYIYTCFCFESNPTPGNQSWRPFTNLIRSEQDPAIGCNNFCVNEKKFDAYIGYQKPGDDVVLVPGYEDIIKPESLKDPQQENPDQCYCDDGNYYPKEGECEVDCQRLGLHEADVDEVPKDTTTDTGTSQPVVGTSCVCNDNTTDTTKTGTACTTFCNDGHQGVKSSPATPPTGQPSSSTTITNPISVNSPLELIQKIINYVLGFVGALAVLIIIYGGLVYMTSRGNEKQIESAKNTLTYAIVGLVVIFASIIIVNTVISAIGG